MTFDRPIMIALILIATILLAFFLVMPQYDSFQQLQQQLGEKRAEYIAQHDYYAAVDKVYYDLQTKKDDIAKIDDALSSDPVLGKTVYFLQQAAQQNGLIVKSLFLSKSSKGEKSTTSDIAKDVVFSLSLSGNYQSLGGFLTSLEDSSRIFEVTSISFGSKELPPYSFSLQIKTYSY